MTAPTAAERAAHAVGLAMLPLVRLVHGRPPPMPAAATLASAALAAVPADGDPRTIGERLDALEAAEERAVTAEAELAVARQIREAAAAPTNEQHSYWIPVRRLSSEAAAWLADAEPGR